MSNSRDDGSTNQRGSTNQSDGPSKTNSLDDRSATAKAAAWVSRIMAISMEMVVPGLIGYWLDIQLGTKFVLMLAGFVLGVTVAIKHLLYLTRNNPPRNTDTTTSHTKQRKDQEP